MRTQKLKRSLPPKDKNFTAKQLRWVWLWSFFGSLTAQRQKLCDHCIQKGQVFFIDPVDSVQPLGILRALIAKENVIRRQAKDGVTVRLYAVWTPTTYTVVFDPGEGATGTMRPVKMTYGRTYTLTGVTFKRAYYTFAGWKEAETGETYANRAKVRDLNAEGATITLVAQWVEVTRK